MYNERFSHFSKAIQKDISFCFKAQMMQAKTDLYLIYLSRASFVYKYTCASYSHKHNFKPFACNELVFVL